MQARRLCYTEKAQNAWHRRGPQKTGNTYNQRNRPSTDTPHKPSTKHYRKGSPGDAQHQLTQQPCMLQHNNNPPSLPAPNRVITRSSQPTQPAAKPRSNTQAGRAALHHRHHPPQRGHAAPPAPRGPIIRSGRWPAQGARLASEQGKGAGGGGLCSSCRRPRTTTSTL